MSPRFDLPLSPLTAPSRLLLLVVLVTATSASGAGAATILYGTDSRSVQLYPNPERYPDTPFGAMPYPGEQSTFFENSIDASARAFRFATGEDTGIREFETLMFTFEVDEAVSADIHMEAYAQNSSAGISFQYSNGIQFIDLVPEVCASPTSTDPGQCAGDPVFYESSRQTADYIVELMPGTSYRVLGPVSAWDDAFTEVGDVHFQLTLQPIPEPGTATLLLTGMAIIGACRHRLTRARPFASRHCAHWPEDSVP